MTPERLKQIREWNESQGWIGSGAIREILDHIAQLEARESQRTAERLPKDGDELQALLNKAYRKGSDDAHAAHAVMDGAQLEAKVIEARRKGMELAAKGILEVRAKSPDPRIGAPIDPSGIADVKIQGIWLDAGEIRKAAKDLGMVEAQRGVAAAVRSAAAVNCTHCGGRGWTNEHDPSAPHHNGECGNSCPVQVPCDFCGGLGFVNLIPADRVLADGMVGVDRNYLRFLEGATTYSPWPSCKTCERGEKTCGSIAYEKGNGCWWWRINEIKRNSLRSAKGEIRYPDDFGPGSMHAETLVKDRAQQAKGE